MHTSSGCTVSDKNGWSKYIDAPDGYFTAHAGEVTIDGDDAADIRELFKLAPQQRLALLGVLGGNAVLPAGFKRVEYLKSGDGGQWIDTEVFTSTSTELELDFNYDAYVWGNMPYGPFDDIVLAMSEPGKTRSWCSYCGKRYYFELMFVIGNRYRIKHNFAGFFVNENKQVSFTGISNFSPKEAICLYRGFKSYPSRVSIYSAKISSNDKVARDFVPCLDATGAPCLFDMVSRKPFYNSGTSDFLYPTESTTYSLRRVLPDWGKLTENGLRRLYHAPANYTGELYDYALENGYKPIVEPEKPETGYWFPRWRETEDEIVLEWVETEPPAEDYLTQPTE